MEQRVLGGTVMSVSVMGFGAMNVGAWGGIDQNAAISWSARYPWPET
jgi:hypothetical protein